MIAMINNTSFVTIITRQQTVVFLLIKMLKGIKTFLASAYIFSIYRIYAEKFHIFKGFPIHFLNRKKSSYFRIAHIIRHFFDFL